MKASCCLFPVTATDVFISMKVNVCDTSGYLRKMYNSKNQFSIVEMLKHIQYLRSAIIKKLFHIHVIRELQFMSLIV
jgi:hypothetical protein